MSLEEKKYDVETKNDWSKEIENPSYISDLILSIINVSVETVDKVYDLLKLKYV